jgi:hypothetical protein
LHQWFDGEDLVYKQSVKYKEKISTMKLWPGGSAQAYINNYLTTLDKLNWILGKGMSPIAQVQAILQGIQDDTYNLCVSLCRNQRLGLTQSISKISTEERDIIWWWHFKRKLTNKDWIHWTNISKK